MIFSSIKKFLGFGPDADLSDPIYADTDGFQSRQSEKSEAKPTEPDARAPKPVEFDPHMQDVIFAKVIEVFNQALPAFLASSVDPEAQRRYLRSQLDEGIREYLANLNSAAEAYCEQQWRVRQNGMASELEAIKLRADDVERRSKDIQQKQLSADRQKRALTERVHDLESQLSKLESECEQLQLENRSLLSRLKVSSVQQDDLDRLNADLLAARAELSRLRENPEAIDNEQRQRDASKIATLETAVDTLKEQLKIADGIRDDLRGKVKDAEATAAERDKTIAERDKEIAELNELITEFDAATTRMEKAEELIKEQRESIASLKVSLGQRDAEIEALKMTIEENAERQAEREDLLRKEIEELRPSLKMIDKEIDFDDDDEVLRITDDDISALEASFEPEPNPTPSPESEKPTEAAQNSAPNPTTTPQPRVAAESPAEKKLEPEKTPDKKRPEQLSLF